MLLSLSAIDRVLEETHTLDGRSIEVKRAIPRDRSSMPPRLVTAITTTVMQLKREEEDNKKAAREPHPIKCTEAFAPTQKLCVPAPAAPARPPLAACPCLKVSDSGIANAVSVSFVMVTL